LIAERIRLLHKLTVLDNGLKVVTNRMVDFHSLALGLWIKTGGRYEGKDDQGVSHFMEHMLFKGTKRRSCQQLKQAIEAKGGIFNAFTAEEYVCYYVKILSEQLDVASDVLTDMVLNSTFDGGNIEKERKVIFEELRMYLDLPMQYVHDLLDELIWPNHPLGMSLVGTYDTVGSIKRSDLIRRKEGFHLPNNIIVAACGNIDHDSFVSKVNKLFKKTRPGKSCLPEKVRPALSRPRTKFYHKDTEQTHICVGTRALSRQHPERLALALLNIILGGNMSSRLFNEIREKRSLAYEIGSSLKQYRDTGSFFVHAGVDNRKVKDAISVIIHELKKVQAKPVSKKELDMAREYYRSGLLMMLESTMSNMLFLGEQIASIGKIDTKDKILHELAKVDIDMINNVSRRIFLNKNLKLAMIGPQEDKEKEAIEKLLRL